MLTKKSLLMSFITLFITSGELSRSFIAKANSHREMNGQIIQLEGEVKVQRTSGKRFSPTLGTRLYPEDQLITGENGSAVLQCADLSFQRIDINQTQGNQCALQDECTPGTVNCPHRGDKSQLDYRTLPYTISPRHTKLLNPQPMLRWNAVPGATSYKVQVNNDLLEPIWTVEVTENFVRYEGEQPLESGVHYWLNVQTNTGADSLDATINSPFNFEVLNLDKLQMVQEKEQAIRQQVVNPIAQEFAVANLYWQLELRSEALEKWENLAQEGVQTSSLYLQLGDHYLNTLDLVPEAHFHYREAIAHVDPQNVEEQAAVQYGVGYTSAILGNQEDALDYLMQAKRSYEELGDLEQVERIEKNLMKFDLQS